MSKEFPKLFLKLHERAIYDMAPALGRIYQVALKEPMPETITAEPLDSAAVVYFVNVRVDRGRRGHFLFRPATQADLDTANAWAKRHEKTPLDRFMPIVMPETW